jgi:hypothetical protein
MGLYCLLNPHPSRMLRENGIYGGMFAPQKTAPPSRTRIKNYSGEEEGATTESADGFLNWSDAMRLDQTKIVLATEERDLSDVIRAIAFLIGSRARRFIFYRFTRN